jgi:hypothetical protein
MQIQDFGEPRMYFRLYIRPNEPLTVLEESTNSADDTEIENIGAAGGIHENHY